jgi:hypothetical protein
MDQVAGYTAADYLIQHATRERRSTRVPGSTWDAMLSHVRDPADAARLADSARNRLLYRYAIPLYRHAADVGDEHAALQLAGLLAERGDLAELRARAGAGDGNAAGQLADVLVKQGRSGEAERLRRFGLNPDGSIACALTHSAERPASAQSPRTAGDPARIRGGAARSAERRRRSQDCRGPRSGVAASLRRTSTPASFASRSPWRSSRRFAVRPAARWCLP